MNRRAFAACASLGIALPLFARSALAHVFETRENTDREAKRTPPRPFLNVDEIVSRLEACYGRATTFKADFNQHTLGMWHGTRNGTAGTVSFESPNQMSWRYARTGNRVVSDGMRVKVYEREAKRLYELDLAKTLYPAALSFLIAQGKLEQHFKFTKPDSTYLGNDGIHALIAEPLRASPVYDRLLFCVDARSYQMRSVLIYDLQGNRTRFDFAAGKVNGSLSEGEFAFTAPIGTQLIQI